VLDFGYFMGAESAPSAPLAYCDDQNGLEGSATRTVNVIAPTGSTQSPAATSTAPSTNDSSNTATSTQATSTSP
jgi:hypothetical protein